MTGRCIIITAGELGDPQRYQECFRPGDFIICCDGGYAHANTLGVKPDLILGDFDSYAGILPQGIPTEGFSSIKDDTDTMLAIKEGIHRGYEEFLLVAALGGRLDHTYANLQSLAYLRRAGKQGCILGAKDRVYLLLGGETLTLSQEKGVAVSVFSYTPESKGVTLEGLYYPLKEASLTSGFPLGVSNKFVEEKAQITLQQGELLIIVSQLESEESNKTVMVQ